MPEIPQKLEEVTEGGVKYRNQGYESNLNRCAQWLPNLYGKKFVLEIPFETWR